MQGQLLGIFIAKEKSASTYALERAHIHAGVGIEGDRYFSQQGTFSKGKKKHRELTMIEIESVIAIKRDYGVEVLPKDLRRNLLVKDVALNHFVGKKLRIGDVVVEGIELCEPCGYLSDLLNHPLKDALKHRGGLRCRVITGGEVKLSMPVVRVDE